MNKYSLILLITAIHFNGYSQTILQPNYALKSHETLEINKITMTPEKTVVSLSIENRIDGGSFCADRKIFIVTPDGTRSRLLSSSGIPVCPDSYKFSKPGEKLDFVLTFPPLEAGTGWFDLIEDCTDNCFSFYGLVLDNDLNERIDEALELAEKGNTEGSVSAYSKILRELKGKKHGIEGGIYSNIIQLLYTSGKKEEAKRWYENLLLSDAPRKEKFIQNLVFRGIKF